MHAAHSVTRAFKPAASLAARMHPCCAPPTLTPVQVPYNEAFLATFKMIPSSETGRIWDRERKVGCWCDCHALCRGVMRPTPPRSPAHCCSCCCTAAADVPELLQTWTVHEYAAALVRSHLRRHGFTVLDGNEATPGKHGAGLLLQWSLLRDEALALTRAVRVPRLLCCARRRPAAAAANLLALEASDARLLPLGTQQEAEQLVSARIPQATWEQLLPHQREGVLAGVRRGGRLLIADEMGLGKTAQVRGADTCVKQHCYL